MNDLPPNIPRQFSPDQCARFASVISTIVSSHPHTTKFNPAKCNLAPETFAGRLRDAMRGYLQFGWQSPFDLLKLETIRPDLNISITTEPGFVVISSKKTPTAPLAHPPVQDGLIVVTPSREVAAALFTLHDKEVLKAPTTLRLLDYDLDLVAHAFPNVAVNHNSTTGDYTIL